MFYISISNGLLTKEHKERMGSAVWEFMWCIDKVTLITKEGIGWVLGGKPIKLDEVGLGHDNTTSRNLHKLEEEGYLKIIRTPYGLKIGVNKAKKRFTKRSDSLKEGITTNSVSPTNNGESPTENGESNKTVSVDNTVDNNIATPEVVAFDWRVEKEKWENDTRRHVQILAYFFERKGMWHLFENKEQLRLAAKRHMRDAANLAKGKWTAPRIKAEMDKLQADPLMSREWVLGTVFKKLTK